MLFAIGLDATEIARFAEWHAKSKKQLARVLTALEIDYCLHNPAKSAERFAARFAAKEALFKALSQQYPGHTVPFLTVCRSAEVVIKRAPELIVAWQKLGLPPCKTHVTITHTQTTAIALVILTNLVDN